MILLPCLLDGEYLRFILSMKQKARKGIIKKGLNQGRIRENLGVMR